MSIRGIMGQDGIVNLARECEYAQRHPLTGPCSIRKMTDEEKERYGDMGARGPKPRVSRYCPECNAELKLRPEQLQQPTITCYKCTGVYDTEQLMAAPKITGGGESDMRPEPTTKEPERKAGTINPEFEKAVQDMMKPSADPDDRSHHTAAGSIDPDDEPIPYEVVKPAPAEPEQEANDGIAGPLAEILHKFNRERQRGFDRGYEEGFEAGKAHALAEMKRFMEASGL